MGNYLSLTELKNTSELIGFSFADYDAEQAINAAEAGIEQYCGRRFTSDAAGATVSRYYTPVEPGYLQIDDLVSAATVQTDWGAKGTFDETWVVNRDYMFEPFNAAVDGIPYERLRINQTSSMRFPSWPRSVRVVGQWGWPAPPPQVKEATTIMATRLLRRAREAPFGVVGLGVDNNPVRITRIDPDVAWLLDNLIKGIGVLAS